MSRSEATGILDRIGLTSERAIPEQDQYSPDAPYRAFGISRKAWGGEPMLDFIKRDGNHEALAYSDIRRIRFNPSKGILILAIDCCVLLRGRCLEEGYQKLVSQRVVFITEADHSTAKLQPEGEPVIISIQIVEKHPNSPELQQLEQDLA